MELCGAIAYEGPTSLYAGAVPISPIHAFRDRGHTL